MKMKLAAALFCAGMLAVAPVSSEAVTLPGGGIIQGVSAADYVAPNKLWVGGKSVVDGGYWTTNEDGSLIASNSSDYNVYYDGDGNLWLNNANIVGQGSGNAATGIYAYYDKRVDTDIALTIHLSGDNSVSNGYPIYVAPWGGDASLTITGPGSLTATSTVGGNGGIFVQGDTSSLTIKNGADVTVNSAKSSAVTIVANYLGTGTLTVDNATLHAYGYVIDEPNNPYGICFSYSENNNVAANSRILNVSGNSIIDTNYMQATYTNLVIDTSGDDGGIIFEGDKGTVYGDVTLQEGLTIGEGESLTVPDDTTLTIPEGVTMTVNDELDVDGTLIVDGNLTNNGTISGSGTLNYENGEMSGSGSVADTVTMIEPQPEPEPEPEPEEPEEVYIPSTPISDGLHEYSLGTMLYIDGKRVKGLYEYEGSTYYFNERGFMQTGWVELEDGWRYFGEDGKMVTGWLQIGNVWYYLDPETGLMYNDGLATIGKSAYYFYDWGGMASDWWYEASDGWYFFGGSGAMKSAQWLEWEGDWYYLTETGRMAVDTEVGGYYLNAEGVWVE